jgi:hypothetical protein
MSTNEPRGDARRTALHTLDRLVGTWAIGGPSTTGTVRYSWFEGDAFLVQEVDLLSNGEVTRGVFYIGWDPHSQTLRSHFFASSGEILEHTHQLAGDTLTIWFGDMECPAKFVGTFDAEGDRMTGGWEWPGGGYEANMTRIEETGRSRT